jgi:hypothetical protein
MHQFSITVQSLCLSVCEVRYAVTSPRCDEKTDTIVYDTDETILDKNLSHSALVLEVFIIQSG